ncbi:MAG: TolC family protein [Flavobacteriales bacterium]|nr:TolC family protein [Flavobacteriales bacterium]
MRIKFFFLLNIFSLSLFSQEKISLQEVLNEVKLNSRAIAKNSLEIVSVEKDLQKFKSTYLPNVNISYSGVSTNNPLNVFGSKLQQSVVTMEDFNPTILNNPDNYFNFNTKISVQQPIINLDVIASKKGVLSQINALTLKGNRIQSTLDYEVKKVYADLVFIYEAIDVNSKALETYKENERVVQNNLQEGFIDKTELLGIQIEVKNIEYQNLDLKQNIANLSDYLSYLMGKPLGTVYKPTPDDIAFVGNENSSIINRSDFQSMKKMIESQQTMLDVQNKKSLPRLNGFGEFNFNDEKPLGFNANSYMVGLQLSWELFDGNKRKYEKEKIQSQIAVIQSELDNQMAQSEMELSKEIREVEKLKFQINLEQSNVEKAKENLRIKKDRFTSGLLKTSDLMVAETQLLEKQLNLLKVKNELLKKQFKIEYLTESNINKEIQ